MTDKYVKLGDLLVYRMSVELSDLAWEIYGQLNWQDKKIIGNQFIEATDSFGANIAEGYGRFHYLDRIKFYFVSYFLNISFVFVSYLCIVSPEPKD